MEKQFKGHPRGSVFRDCVASSIVSRLDEKDFVVDDPRQFPIPFWIFAVAVISLILGAWAISSWYSHFTEAHMRQSPLLQVTNREISLFLWQHPEWMRLHVQGKTGYLPGFPSGGSPHPDLASVDRYLQGPPALLLRYHLWNAHLADITFRREISTAEFREFIASSPEWGPDHWPEAPFEYRQLIDRLSTLGKEDLQMRSELELPSVVRRAFTGWKNYYKEGEKINRVTPSAKEVRTFIRLFPGYAPGRWQELYPDYLKSLANRNLESEEQIPEAELSGFLRAGLYNYSMQTKP